MERFSADYPGEMERRRKIAAARTMHGHRIMPEGSQEYRTFTSWASMRQRCLNSGRKDYFRYGGRGISIAPEWTEYSQFLADIGLVPEGKSLDRKDNSLNYGADNCKWSTKQEQARNRRTSKMLLINGEEKTLAEWSEISGIPSSTIRMRITRGDAINGKLLRLALQKVG
jgi:hypothetical protein